MRGDAGRTRRKAATRGSTSTSWRNSTATVMRYKKEIHHLPVSNCAIRFLIVLLAIVLLAAFLPTLAQAQGCIVARSAQQTSGAGSEAGYLAPHHWELTIDYRHQFSFRHFVGDVEQTQRIQQNTQVENRMNLQNFQITYQATPRWSFSANLPLMFASRRSGNSFSTFHASGFGDMILSAQTWLLSPSSPHRGNLQIGYGVLFPTGADKIQNTFLASPTATSTTTRPVDYSIQPGAGGWGIVLQGQAFRILGKQQIYTNASYIITPQSQNSYIRNPTATTQNPLTSHNSISDQYLLESGIAFDIPQEKVHGLAFTFGPRFEGVPAHDLIGDDNGFRRPGFALSLEPGFRFSLGHNLLTGSIGRAVWRARVKSVPDIQTGGHGDAAFADWVWSATFSRRF